MLSLSLSLLVKSALTPHAAVIGGDEVTARRGPGPGKGDEGHFHVCRTALNTHSLGCVSERTASCDLRSSYPRLKHRTD